MPSWLEAVKSNDPWSAAIGLGSQGNAMEQGRFGIVSGCFRYCILYIVSLVTIVSWCPCYRPIHIFVLLICSNHRLLMISILSGQKGLNKVPRSGQIKTPVPKKDPKASCQVPQTSSAHELVSHQNMATKHFQS